MLLLLYPIGNVVNHQLSNMTGDVVVCWHGLAVSLDEKMIQFRVGFERDALP